MGRGLQVPDTDLQGHRVAVPQYPHQGHLLFQVVEPAVELSLAGAENEERSGQWAWGWRSRVG